MKDKVLVTGGCGYVGTPLVSRLLDLDYDVVVYDLCLYQQHNLIPSNSLKLIKGDVRDTEFLSTALKNVDKVIHLACISNDPSFELDPILSKSINLDCFKPFVEACKNNGVKQFINASSSSVYGIKDHSGVIETSTLNPITPYSEYKAQCEDILHSAGSNNFVTTSLRPATVCGFSNRLRLDVVYNIFMSQAIYNNRITVFGGSQKRCNIAIEDMIEAYVCIMNAEVSEINNQVFNVGTLNQPIIAIAEEVRNILGDNSCEIVTNDSNDLRSYQISSEKIEKTLGYKECYGIQNTLSKLKSFLRATDRKDTIDNINCFNVKALKNHIANGTF